jgi:photosystem II stability/assembly factor-like uncharacterized protein
MGLSLWPEKPAKTSGALEALDYWSAQRAYPNRIIPSSAYSRAFEKSRSFRKTLGSTAPWQTLGPHNLAGRTLALAFNPQNPNTIYAGSASGGLWVSRTAGVGASAWTRVETGYPVLGVGAIAIEPDDSNTIYIGTGEVYGYQDALGGLSIRTTRGSYGIGILKTTNGGATWTKSLDWAYQQERGVQAVRINPMNPRVLFAGTTEGVYKSTDAGETWLQVHNVIMAMDVLIHPSDTNLVFAACGNLGTAGRGIYRSTNGGQSWTQLGGGLPATFGGKANFAVHAPSGLLFASIGNGSVSGAKTYLCKSYDNGNTWVTDSTTDYSTYQGWYSHGLVVRPVDSSIVIAAGIDIWKSTTGGSSLVQKSYWYKYYGGTPAPGDPEGPPDYSHADHHAVIWHPTNPSVVYFGNDGGVFRSTDAGETFGGCNGGYQSSQFYNGFANSSLDSNVAIGGLQDNASAMYRGSVAWERDLIGGDGAWCAVDENNDQILYGSIYYLSIYKSTDDGQDWFYIAPSLSGVSNFVSPFVLAPTNNQIIYAAKSRVARSINGGSSWTTLNGGAVLDGNPVLSLAVSYSTADVVYAGTTPISVRAGIFVTTNGGTTWQNVTGSLPDRYPVDIAVDPTNDSVAYVAFSGFGTSHLFKTTSRGQGWIDVGSTLPDAPTSAVVVDPMHPDHVYAGNDLGVYASTDGGSSWAVYQDGLPGACLVMDLTISAANRKLRVATHGNGVYERDLLGEVVAVGNGQAAPRSFVLEQNFPNPFNNSTTIDYEIATSARVSLRIYNLLGDQVRTLESGYRAAGRHRVLWDGRDDRAHTTASGIYIYRLASGSRSVSRKLMFIK